MTAIEKYNEFTKAYSKEFERINKLTATMQMTKIIMSKYEELTQNHCYNIIDAVSFFAKKSACGNRVF